MAKIVISMKIFPTDVMDLNKLKDKIGKNLPKDATVYGSAEEPVAFGLNALILHIMVPEEKSGVLDELEKCFEKIPEISQVQTLRVQRA